MKPIDFITLAANGSSNTMPAPLVIKALQKPIIIESNNAKFKSCSYTYDIDRDCMVLKIEENETSLTLRELKKFQVQISHNEVLRSPEKSLWLLSFETYYLGTVMFIINKSKPTKNILALIKTFDLHENHFDETFVADKCYQVVFEADGSKGKLDVNFFEDSGDDVYTTMTNVLVYDLRKYK